MLSCDFVINIFKSFWKSEHIFPSNKPFEWNLMNFCHQLNTYGRIQCCDEACLINYPIKIDKVIMWFTAKLDYTDTVIRFPLNSICDVKNRRSENESQCSSSATTPHSICKQGNGKEPLKHSNALAWSIYTHNRVRCAIHCMHLSCITWNQCLCRKQLQWFRNVTVLNFHHYNFDLSSPMQKWIIL